jgi:hypothetical protein
MTELTQERLKELLSYDTETGVFTNLTQRRRGCLIGDAVGYKRPDGYICIQIDYKRYYAHRLAWFYMYGYFSILQIDHINQVKDDNRIINLRLVTAKQNLQNVSKPHVDNKSGYLGVSWNKNKKKWIAQITANKEFKYLGCFNSPEEASEEYLKAKQKLHFFWK